MKDMHNIKNHLTSKGSEKQQATLEEKHYQRAQQQIPDREVWSS